MAPVRAAPAGARRRACGTTTRRCSTRSPPERRHLRIHLGHNCWVIPEEERFVTKELLEASCLIGTADELVGAAARPRRRRSRPGGDPAVAGREGAGPARRGRARARRSSRSVGSHPVLALAWREPQRGPPPYCRVLNTSNDGSPMEARPDQPTPDEVLERALFEVKHVLVGQDAMIERLFVCWLARGHCLLEGAPGLAKTLAAKTLARVLGGTFARIQFTPDLRARRPRRHPHLPPVARAVRRRARPGVRQRRAGRRDQPGPSQGAVGAARGDGRAPGVDRRRRPIAVPEPVHRAGHAEPDRERGRLPAARGPARPLPDEGRRRLPERPRGGRDRPPDERQPAGGQPGASTRRRLGRPAATPPARCSSTTPSSTTPCASSPPPAARPRPASTTSRRSSPTASAPAPRSASSPRPGPWP